MRAIIVIIYSLTYGPLDDRFSTACQLCVCCVIYANLSRLKFLVCICASWRRVAVIVPQVVQRNLSIVNCKLPSLTWFGQGGEIVNRAFAFLSYEPHWLYCTPFLLRLCSPYEAYSLLQLLSLKKSRYTSCILSYYAINYIFHMVCKYTTTLAHTVAMYIDTDMLEQCHNSTIMICLNYTLYMFT